jgi:hypothetical protein
MDGLSFALEFQSGTITTDLFEKLTHGRFVTKRFASKTSLTVFCNLCHVPVGLRGQSSRQRIRKVTVEECKADAVWRTDSRHRSRPYSSVMHVARPFRGAG